MSVDQLEATIQDLVIRGQGILAADESTGTIGKRLQTINVESTIEARRGYRSLLATTPNLGDHVSGVILFEETLTQNTDQGESIPQAFAKQGIVPGIKVDKGLVTMPNSPNEKITQGLDGLEGRLATYKEQGARFAKWREVFSISNNTPTQIGLQANAEMLARYAAACQAQGIVPIVEPELLMDGDHNLQRCGEVTEAILFEVFSALQRHNISFEHMLLKPNMVIPGADAKDQSNPDEIGKATIKVLRRTVPAAVPSINFLSGGQSSIDASRNLQAINSQGPQPWYLTFSYGRALQELCLKAWGGRAENMNAAQDALFKRSKLNGAAAIGEYKGDME